VSTVAVGVEPGRGSLRLLADRTVGPYVVGKLLSATGVWMHNITAAIVVFQLTGSAILVGAVSVAQFAPQIFLTPWSGARADRADRRRQLLAGRLLTGAGSGGLVVWMWTVGLSGGAGAAAVIVAAFVIGVGFSVGGPAMESLLPTLVRPGELAAAVALNTAPVTIARAAGPALGALLVAVSGPELAFGVAALCQVAFFAIVALCLDDAGRVAAVDSSFRAGLRHVRSDRRLTALLLGICVVGVGADPLITLTPSLAASLGAGDELAGALASTFGLGMALAFPLLGPCRRRFGLHRLAVGGQLVLAAGLAGLAASSTAPLALVSVGVAGIGMTASMTGLTTLIQQRTPDEFRGRVMSLWAVGFLGSRPLAAAVNGTLAELTSLATALLTTVGILLLGAWAVGASRSAREPAHAGHGPRPAGAA